MNNNWNEPLKCARKFLNFVRYLRNSVVDMSRNYRQRHIDTVHKVSSLT